MKESEVPDLVVTTRDTDVRRRPAACVVVADIDSDADVVLDAHRVRSARRANRADRDRRGGQGRSAALLETPATVTRIEEEHVDVVPEAPHTCRATTDWRQEAACAGGSAGADPSDLAETSRASCLTDAGEPEETVIAWQKESCRWSSHVPKTTFACCAPLRMNTRTSLAPYFFAAL